ncbi:MAG: DsbA family protein [Nanoarchaeota archaeon]
MLILFLVGISMVSMAYSSGDDYEGIKLEMVSYDGVSDYKIDSYEDDIVFMFRNDGINSYDVDSFDFELLYVSEGIATKFIDYEFLYSDSVDYDDKFEPGEVVRFTLESGVDFDDGTILGVIVKIENENAMIFQKELEFNGEDKVSFVTYNEPSSVTYLGSDSDSNDEFEFDYKNINKILGDEDAPVQMTFFFDYNEPFTKKFLDETFDDIVDNFVDEGDLSINFVPGDLLADDEELRKVGRCVYEIDGIKDYIKYVEDSLDELDSSSSRSEKIDFIEYYYTKSNEYWDCYTSEDVKEAIERELDYVEDNEVMGFPSFVFKNIRTGVVEEFSGAQDYSKFKETIQDLLEEGDNVVDDYRDLEIDFEIIDVVINPRDRIIEQGDTMLINVKVKNLGNVEKIIYLDVNIPSQDIEKKVNLGKIGAGETKLSSDLYINIPRDSYLKNGDSEISFQIFADGKRYDVQREFISIVERNYDVIIDDENDYDLRDREDEVCQGCSVESSCLQTGIRLVSDDVAKYCDVDGDLKNQKIVGATCQNNFECSSNTCSSGKCVDLVQKLDEQTSILENILGWFKSIFFK